MSKRPRILLGGILLTLMSAYFGVYIYSLSLPNRGSDDGWRGTWAGRGDPIITDLAPNGWMAGLRVGDEIIAINGIKIKDDPRVLGYNSSAPPGTQYTMTVRRMGALRDVSVQTVSFSIRFDPLYYISLLFLLTGWGVFLLRSDDKQSWLLAVMLGTMMGLGSDPANLPIWLNLFIGAMGVVELLSLPIFVHFFLIFPDPSPPLRRWARLETLLYLPYLLVIIPAFLLSRLSGELGLSLLQFKWFGYFTLAASIFIILYLAAGLACLMINYRAASLIARRKLRVVMAGSAAGFFNLFVLVVGGQAGLQLRTPALWAWTNRALFVTLPLIPLSFVYAIARHKVIPLSLIIRRGMRYLLVSRGAEIIEAIAVASLVLALFHIVFSHWHVNGEIAGAVSAIVAVLLWDSTRKLHKRFLAPLIDRRFFRQSYDSQRIVADLTGALRTVTDLPQLLELVATKLRTALQTEHVTMYLREPATGSFNRAHSCDYGASNGDAVNLPQSGQLAMYASIAERLDQLGKTLGKAAALQPDQQRSNEVEPVEIEPDFLNAFDGGVMSTEEQETLREVKATLLMPLFSKDKMLGIISLGPRLGDLPFSREDKQLLKSVSGPTALAIENTRLVEQMVAEARRVQEIEIDHLRKSEELAFARQLQLSMLPSRNIALDNIEIIGQMRTATEVGGDYYDFIEMPDGRICIVAGDATGHGMAAGLVVGMVKMGLVHSLQGAPQGEPQRENGYVSVKPLVEDLNRSLKHSLSQRGMGMCLGAAILDVSTLTIEVVSNGMPTPYHYHAASRSLLPIPTQAPPLGFLREVNVRPVEMRLRPGDALIWLSDGFEERLNHANQIWGSEQVEQALERICDEESSAADIARRMIDACDGAARGRSNDDDMTIVVAKVKAG